VDVAYPPRSGVVRATCKSGLLTRGTLWQRSARAGDSEETALEPPSFRSYCEASVAF